MISTTKRRGKKANPIRANLTEKKRSLRTLSNTRKRRSDKLLLGTKLDVTLYTVEKTEQKGFNQIGRRKRGKLTHS